MRLYENNLFSRLTITLALILVIVLVMVAWWQMLFSKTLEYYVVSEKTSLETQIYIGMHQDENLLGQLIRENKIEDLKECKKKDDVCVKKIQATGYYAIAPGYEAVIYAEKKRKIHMFYWETSFLICILLLTIVYMFWVISREKKTQQEKLDFLAMTTHELKHPVSVLSLLLESLDRETLPKERVSEFIHKGMGEVKTLKKSLENILKIQDISMSGHKSVAAYKITVLFKSLKDNWEIHSLNRDQRIEFEAGHESDFMVHTSMAELSTIFNNLLENALLYSKEKVFVKTGKDQKGNFIEVKDQGIGFTQEDKKNFQKMFFRSNRYDVQNISGSGLGHFIIQKLLHKNSLSMTLESEGENKGSTFRVYLR